MCAKCSEAEFANTEKTDVNAVSNRSEAPHLNRSHEELYYQNAQKRR